MLEHNIEKHLWLHVVHRIVCVKWQFESVAGQKQNLSSKNDDINWDKLLKSLCYKYRGNYFANKFGSKLAGPRQKWLKNVLKPYTPTPHTIHYPTYCMRNVTKTVARTIFLLHLIFILRCKCILSHRTWIGSETTCHRPATSHRY